MATNNYNSEDTQYLTPEDETTELSSNSEPQTDEEQPTAEANTAQADKSVHSWKNTAASAGIGILIGSAIPVFSSMISKDDAETQDEELSGNAVDSEEQHATPNHSEVLSHPELVDDEVPVATSVTSDMTFGQAFAAARAEVGPGGVFEWHGNLYGTYTAEEWNSMSASEQAEYGEHFAWNQIDHQQSDVAPQDAQLADNTTVTAEVADDDIVVTHVDQPSEAQQDGDLVATATEEPAAGSNDSEVVILGVTHDADSGMNVGGMVVDGHEIVLVDVDGDMKFDVAVEDVNHNGQLDEQDLMQDISHDNITVDMLQQNTTDHYAANTGMDSGSEGGYEA